MYAAHIIGLKSKPLTMIGRGSADPAKVKLALKNADDYEVHVCREHDTTEGAIRDQLAMRAQAFEAFGHQPNGGWYRARFSEMCAAAGEPRDMRRLPPTSAQAMQAAMQAYGLSQNELAEMIGRHKTLVGRVLKGRGELSFSEYQMIRWWGVALGLIEVFDALLLQYEIRSE